MKCWFFLCFIFFVYGGSFCCAQAADGITPRYFNNFEDSVVNAVWMNPNTITESSDSVKNHFSRTDKTNAYSSGIEIEIPAGLKGKNFTLSVKGLKRISGAGANNQLVISVALKDSAIFWKGEHLTDSADKLNEWRMFGYSTLVPGNIPRDSKIKIFVWNADGKSETDIDDLEIYFTETKFPSFLPE